MEKEKIITIIFALIIFGLLAIVILGSKNKKTNTSTISKDQITIYYGITCPHCRQVEEWMKENNIKDKISILEKEVYENRINSAELAKAAENCDLDTTKIGVPFLYAQGKCYMGKPDVINYLSQFVGLAQNESTDSANLESTGSANN